MPARLKRAVAWGGRVLYFIYFIGYALWLNVAYIAKRAARLVRRVD